MHVCMYACMYEVLSEERTRNFPIGMLLVFRLFVSPREHIVTDFQACVEHERVVHKGKLHPNKENRQMSATKAQEREFKTAGLLSTMRPPTINNQTVQTCKSSHHCMYV